MAIELPAVDDGEELIPSGMAALFDLAGMEHEGWMWRIDAACRGEDPATFFPDTPDSSTARAVCAPCPVRADCLEHALRYEKSGIWGGTSASERHRMRKRMGIRLIELAPDDDELHDIEHEQEEDGWQ